MATDRSVALSSASQSLWRPLRYFSYYRLIVAAVFLGIAVFAEGPLNLGTQNPRLFLWTCVAYLSAGVAILATIRRWEQAFNLQLTAQVFVDILCLTLLLFASGGAKSGMSMMLLVVLVGAGLVGQGRLVLFYAAMATLFLLAEQTYRILRFNGDIGDYFSTGITSVGFFGSAIVARLLANRMIANEALAHRRGVELADQMRISERVIRDMQDGVLVIDAEGRIGQCNPRARALLGWLGGPMASLADGSPVLAEEYRKRRVLGVESELMMQIPWNGRALRVRFLPPGEGGNAVIFLEDVGQLQQEARQMKLAALGRLTANMAHEIRNPLSAISQAAELLADEPSGADAGRLTRIIGDNAQRLNRLVSEVVELGRRDRVTPEPIDLREFLSRLIDERSLHDADCARRVAVHVPDGIFLRFDRGHLHRVVSNLLDNALRHASSDTGAVRIVAEHNTLQNRLSVHVVDDGPGIGEETRDQMFEPFFTTRPAGTGLGLYIARELCEANGARLFLLENAPGAHFCISCGLSDQEQRGDSRET